MVRNEHLEQERSRDKEQGHQTRIDSRDQLTNFPHGGHIGGDVEGVRHQKKEDGALQNRWREGPFDIRSKPPSGNTANKGTHRLNRCHEREGQRHGPEHVEAKLRSRLRVSHHTAWVVISHPGDQPWADLQKGVFLKSVPRRLESIHARGFAYG